MSAFAGSDGAYQALTGGNIFGPKPARTLQRIPPVKLDRQQPGDEGPAVDRQAAIANGQKQIDVDNSWRQRNAQRNAYTPEVQQSQVNINPAQTMDAWRQRRSQVGALKRDLQQASTGVQDPSSLEAARKRITGRIIA